MIKLHHYTMHNNNKNNKYRQKKNKPNINNLKRLIFPPIDNDKLALIKIDTESYKYISFHQNAIDTTNIIIKNLGPTIKTNELTITDITAGVGGNVLNFANHFKHVNAIELDNSRCIFLKNNTDLYGHSNISIYHGDSVELLIDKYDNNIVSDIIFFDPPWGGRNYKNFTNLKLSFGKYSIEKIIESLFGLNDRLKMVVIKIPSNYDIEYFNNELKKFEIDVNKLERMIIAVVKPKSIVNNI